MQIELTIYIIKPEATLFCDNIHFDIESNGLSILKTKTGYLPPHIVENLYYNSPLEIIEASKYFMCRDVCEVGIVQGLGAIQKLRELCGAFTNPRECNQQTIRYKYGIHTPVYFSNILYYRNGFHCPKTIIETKNNSALLSPFLT